MSRDKATARTPGRPRQPLSRSELLTVARRAFGRYGYAGTSLNVIADGVGIRAASLFNHCAGKEALYREVLGEIVGDLHDLIITARLDEGDYAERLDRLGGLIVEYLGDHADAGQLLLREMMDRGPYMQSGGHEAVRQTLDTTVSFLEAGMREGAFRRQDPHHLALSIIGVHLFYFSVPVVASRKDGAEPYAPEETAVRQEMVLEHVRRLCGVAERTLGNPKDALSAVD